MTFTDKNIHDQTDEGPSDSKSRSMSGSKPSGQGFDRHISLVNLVLMVILFYVSAWLILPRVAFGVTLVFVFIYAPIWLYFYAVHIFPHRHSIIPGDRPWTPFGSMFQLGILPSFGFHLFGCRGSYSYLGGRTLCEGLSIAHAMYGDVYAVWLGFDRVIMFNTADSAKYIYSQTRATYDQAEYLRDRQKGIAAKSLSTTVGEEHRRHVKALGPMLKRYKLIPFIPKMTEIVKKLIDKLSQPDASRHEPYTRFLTIEYKALMLDIFGALAFDHTINAIDLNFTSKNDVNAFEALAPLPLAILTIIDRVAKKFLFAVPGKLALTMEQFDPKLMKARATIKEYLLKAIEKSRLKQAEFDSTHPTSGTDASSEETLMPCSNLLELLVSSTEGSSPVLSVDELFDDLTLFLFAGTDSSSSMLGFATYYLSKHPSIQTKVKEELWAVFGKPEKATTTAPWRYMPAPTADELASLPYLDCVVQETLRLSMTSLGASRQANQDDVIEGHQIKKGDNLLVNAIQIQHDERFYPDAMQFKPERWLNEVDKSEAQFNQASLQVDVAPSPSVDDDLQSSSTLSSRRYPPPVLHTFGGGHRMCVGMQLAKLELKLILALILRHASFQDTGVGNTHLMRTHGDGLDVSSIFSIQIAVPDIRHLEVKFVVDS